MAEIIAKSKEHKYERQQQREMDAELREELDDDIADLQMLLAENAPITPAATIFPTTSKPHPAPMPLSGEEVIGDGEYDQIVRSLAFDARAKPKNRTKTEEELALEEKENLEKAETKRLRRMRGESVSDGEEEEGSRKKRKADNKKPDADDLEDDYVEDEALLGPGLTREQIETMVLSGSEAGSDDEQDEEAGTEEEGSFDEDAEEEEDESDVQSAMEDLDESEEVSMSEGEEVEPVVKRTKGKKTARTEKVKEIPYTFPCPANIEEFEEIVDPLEDSALPTVVQRIRALHHPSLAQGNKEKLQVRFDMYCYHVLSLTTFETGIPWCGNRLRPHSFLPSFSSIFSHPNTCSASHSPRQVEPRHCRCAFCRKNQAHAKESFPWTGSRCHQTRFQNVSWCA